MDRESTPRQFVDVLDRDDLESATRLSDMLRRAVFDCGVEHVEEYNHTPSSISTGVAEGETTEDARALIGRADTALHEAKHNGRNRVERAA